MSENTQIMKQERERRYAILITALQDFIGADMRYTAELENLLGVENKAVETKKTEELPPLTNLEKARARKNKLEKGG